MGPETWTRLDSYCQLSQKTVHLAGKERQIRKFNALKLQQPQQQLPKFTLNHKKLVVKLSTRILSLIEEEVLAFGLSFAIAPTHIPHQEIIAATGPLHVDRTRRQQMH